MTAASLAGLELLATSVVMVDQDGMVRYMNPAAENLFKLSSKNAVGAALAALFPDNAMQGAIAHARHDKATYTEHDLELAIENGRLRLSCTVTPVETGASPDDERYLLEFRHIEQQLKIAREERILDQSQANRELIRNLAHEIKNPLGGIRGAAQLLDHELERPNLHEYTQVIMKEADRLQSLMDRLLTPHRLPQPTQVNIHEVLERVRSVILAEYPRGVAIRRDYDTSLPTITGDREQLIQAVLNIVRNAAQAIVGRDGDVPYGEIRFRTRIARQVTLARRRHRHALEVTIRDNGPGIPEGIREHVFYPLVSGRDGGTGLGLTLAQNFISQHHGTVTFESAPGNTAFTILLPVPDTNGAGKAIS